jgi:hypothetical protein
MAGAQRHAQVAKDLAIPRAFSMSDLQQRLERYSGRAVHVSPAELGSGSPAGIWFRKNGADYLFYEQHTSPFHQAHIVLGLAAHALLVDADARMFDPRLTPDLGIELVRLMLGDIAPSPLSDANADDFAFLALRSACQSVNWFKARRSLRRLEPLRCALLSAVPQAARAPGYTALPGVTRRLCQAVVEIRDAALALRAFRDPEVGAAASDAGRAAGLAGRDLAAAVEAAVLADAIRACHAGEESGAKPGSQAIDPPLLTADLACEVDWLIHLSRAFRSRLSPASARLSGLGVGGDSLLA